MFSMFSSRYSSYHHRSLSSDDEDEKPSNFALKSNDNNTTNEALERALASADQTQAKIALESEMDQDMDLDAAVQESLKHLCIECRDQPAILTCVQCDDRFCEVCFAAMHRRGNRSSHKHAPYASGVELNTKVNVKAVPAASSSSSSSASAAAASSDAAQAMDESNSVGSSSKPAAAAVSSSSDAAAASSTTPDLDDDDDDDEMMAGIQAKRAGASSATGIPSSAASAASPRSDDSDDESVASSASHYSSASAAAAAAAARPIALPTNAMNSSLLTGSSTLPADWFMERARYIPLRLTLEERKFLRLLEASLNVSEYTDKIDIISSKDKLQRIKEQLRDICSILSGLVVANDYKLGCKLLKDKEFADNAEFFRNIFELGRRHKIRNPEKMRNSYGKLLFILQDSLIPQVEELMGFHLYAPLKTVYSRLEAAGSALDCLRDEHMMTATGDIKTEGRSRPEIERDIKRKEAAVKYLANKYKNAEIDEEGMRSCILSIADNHTYLIQNRHCCDDMIQWLRTLYDATTPVNPYSLAILGGRAGARLTHSHANQYSYVLQSLTLWREVLHDMFSLWCKTEADLMDPENPYRLRNTGQGLNRVQSAPRVGKAMHNILYHCQRKLGNWVGSSVIHLGDHNVPNALMFIDKYNQVSRILNPIVLTIKAIPRLCEKKDVKFYIDSVFGGAEKLRLLILTDFFRHAFDGSGADNFFDAGSCIDGRLTSAWNWCSGLEKKSYYTIFQLAGFSSFDGQWSD